MNRPPSSSNTLRPSSTSRAISPQGGASLQAAREQNAEHAGGYLEQHQQQRHGRLVTDPGAAEKSDADREGADADLTVVRGDRRCVAVIQPPDAPENEKSEESQKDAEQQGQQ